MRRRLLLIAAAGAALVLAWPWLARTGQVALAFADLAGRPVPGWLDPRPCVRRETQRLDSGGPVSRADLYRAGPSPGAALLLVHGLTPQGKDDPRLMEFARQLARAGFLVVVPDLPSLSQRRLTEDTIEEATQSLAVLARYRDQSDTGRSGVAAISVAAGPAILAAARARDATRPDFLFTLGGYHDLVDTLRFQMTGVYERDGVRVETEPHPYAKWAFLLSQLERIEDRADRRALASLARRRMAAGGDPGQGPAPEPDLGPEGRAVLAFVENQDPQRFAALYDRLPSSVRDGVAALDLSRMELSGLDLPALLVHGRNDPVIPYPETRGLARALEVPDSRVFVIDGLKHVASPGLGDAVRLWRAVDALLGFREG